jgi:hypothetical protein
MLVKNFDELPEQIKVLLINCKYDKSKFICGFKTVFKIDERIPYLWIIVISNSIVLCSTYKAKGIWALYNNSELNSVLLKTGSIGCFSIEILAANPNTPAIILPLHRNTSTEDANELLKCCRELINSE